MDTGTHIVMGVAIGGLATLDPAVQSDPALFNAVLVGTIAGSHAPDLDTVLKLRNNATYLRHHRGATHSIPAILMWGVVISGIIHAFVPSVDFIHLWAWTFLAVAVHVLTDIFNAYGTQAFRPFTNKWIAYGFINTFDPYIFGLHIAGIIGWVLGLNPGPTWLIIYAVIVLYYIKRYLEKREIVTKIHDHYRDVEKIATSPTVKQNKWRVAITTQEQFHVGSVEDGHIEIVDTFDRQPLPDTPIMKLAQNDKNIAAFLSFSPVYRWVINEYDDFTEVRFIDLRYRARGRYPFVAVVQIDMDHNIKSSYTGWIYSEHKLRNKLYISDYPV
ncbi:metal-dependent hydrolase [Lentibacillus saliphilus]|uniref:metal-dependent hydrolase n=1 Tax=Lentibacillus saliphilus TaxID=2737028 RepID=UPI001C30388B|nr:metal-dependent hydrolase [Lentibacillus saliphilus]